MSKEHMAIISIILLSIAIAHGLYCGYCFANGTREPFALQAFWRVCFFAGVYAAWSWLVAMGIWIVAAHIKNLP